MTTDWREIGIDNFRSGCQLVDSQRAECYRSGVSRFYYAAFSVLTDALAGTFDTASGQETPNHKGLPRLIRTGLPDLNGPNRAEVLRIVRRLYAARLDADYRRRTVDKRTAQDARRDVVALFEALGVKYGD
jgi:hypothetical protein